MLSPKNYSTSELDEGKTYYKNEKEETEIYEPTQRQLEVSNRVYQRFISMRSERDKRRRAFHGMNLIEYVNYSMDLWNGIVPDEVKATKEDWQSIIFDNKIRGKVKALISMVVASVPYINIIGKDEDDNKHAFQMQRAFDDTNKKNYESYQRFLEAFSCATKGTVIKEEYFCERKKKVKEVSNYNEMTGDVTYREKTVIDGGYGYCKSKIVPLVNFYPNENFPDISGDCIVVSYPRIDEFKRKYGGYKLAKYVNVGKYISDNSEALYKRDAEDTSENIEVLKYYNEFDDELIILANGIWINPQGENMDGIGPIPYNHKALPFTKTVFEPADEEEFYGKSLPDLGAGEQETINALLRMVVDQEVLSIHKPILLGSGNEIDSYSLYPGKTYNITGDISQVREMDLSGANPMSIQLIDYLRKQTDENMSVDLNSQGVFSGGRKTAREAVILDENAKRVASVFRKNLYKLTVFSAMLRIENIKQFYNTPVGKKEKKHPDGRKFIGEDGQPVMVDKMRTIATEDNQGNINYEELKPEMFKGDYILRVDEDVEVPASRMARIESAKALVDEAKAGNTTIDFEEATLDYLVAWGKSPKRFFIPYKQRSKSPEEEQAEADEQAAQYLQQGGGGGVNAMLQRTLGGNQAEEVPEEA